MPDVSVVTYAGRYSGEFDGTIPGVGTLFLRGLAGRYAGEFEDGGVGGFKILGRVGLITASEFDGGLITNPSFETNTTGWAAGGTNTIQRVAAASEGIPPKFGTQILKVTYQNTTSPLTSFDLTLPADDYVFGIWVYVPTAWDSGTLRWQTNAFTGQTLALAEANLNLRNQWQYIEGTTTIVAGDTTGNIRMLSTAPAPTAGRFFYIEGAHVRAA